MAKALDEKSQYKRIVTHFREALSAMSELHAEFKEYDDFYLAKQWNSKRASWRPDPVINYVSYIVDQKAPQLTNNKPTGLILPTAQGDEEAAKVFTQVTEVISERVDLEDKIDQVVRTGLLFGTGWFKVYWDNSLQGGNVNKQNLWKGDVCIDVPDVANIYTDPSATSINDCRYIIYAVPKSVQWIEEKFNVKVDAEQAFETEIYDRPSVNHSKNMVMFYEYWTKDKNGVHVIYAASGKILKRIEKVYKHGKFPFVPFVAKKNRKSIWGIGEPKNIINNQKLLNKVVELPTTNTLLHANPITLVKANSGIDPSKWENKPGKIYPVKDVTDAAKYMEPPRMSNDVYKLADLMREYIERIGGVYDSVTGETPSGVTAAAAIQMLQEQGSIPIKGIARNLYQSIKDVYELMIELVKENYTETRYIRITEEEGTYDFLQFKGSDYGEIDFDVKVSAGASTPTSKAFIAQLASELFDKQILLPSEYVEMQEGLPNKDRIVQRLREQEQQQPQKEEQPMGPQGLPDFQTFVDNAPPELQQEIQLMMEQGMDEQTIMQALLAPR